MCTRPLKGFLNGLNENGKKDLVIAPFETDHIEVIDGKKVRTKDNIVYNKKMALTEFIQVPCGQCIECRLNRSRKWADRCMMELQYHKESHFVTLTYDNDHIPKSEITDLDTGEMSYNATLVKKDLQDFMKRLRRAYEYSGKENQLRFFACGEYGSKTMRPHFHLILFGLELENDDLSFYKRNFHGDNLYNSKLIEKCWKNGFSVVADVTWETCAYVARYIMKKHLGKDSDFYDLYGIEPEFTLMSRRPGIARQYYEDHKEDLFTQDFVSLPTKEGGRKVYPPPYFERLFEEDFPEQDVCERKERRMKAAIDSMNLQLQKTSKSEVEYLKTKEYSLDSKIKSLIREDI